MYKNNTKCELYCVRFYYRVNKNLHIKTGDGAFCATFNEKTVVDANIARIIRRRFHIIEVVSVDASKTQNKTCAIFLTLSCAQNCHSNFTIRNNVVFILENSSLLCVCSVACAVGCQTCSSSSLCLSCKSGYAPQTSSPPYTCGGNAEI